MTATQVYGAYNNSWVTRTLVVQQTAQESNPTIRLNRFRGSGLHWSTVSQTLRISPRTWGLTLGEPPYL